VDTGVVDIDPVEQRVLDAMLVGPAEAVIRRDQPERDLADLVGSLVALEDDDPVAGIGGWHGSGLL
jgi:hypothetical protein